MGEKNKELKQDNTSWGENRTWSFGRRNLDTLFLFLVLFLAGMMTYVFLLSISLNDCDVLADFK